MLTRRESNLLLELMACKDDEAKKSELINKLRRVKSAMALVDELIEEEKAIEQASEEDENNRKKRRAEEASKKPAVKRSAHPNRLSPKAAHSLGASPFRRNRIPLNSDPRRSLRRLPSRLRIPNSLLLPKMCRIRANPKRY